MSEYIKKEESITSCFECVENGDLAAVSSYINNNINNNDFDINIKNKDGDNLLILAARYGYYDIAKLLIENGADIHKTDNEKHNALVVAAINGKCRVAELLIESNANIEDRSKDFTALLYAARQGHVNVVKLLIEKGANIEASSNNGCAALWLAARNGHTSTAKYLIERGVDLNAVDKDGDSSILIAARYGHYDIVKLLIENGADIHKTDNEKHNALVVAAMNGKCEVAELLIESNANIEDRSTDFTPLLFAARGGHVNVVKLLIEKGANIEASSNEGYTALTLAAHNGHTSTVKYLIDKGVDVNAVNKDGISSLIIAAINDHYDIAKLLIENGADIHKTNNDGKTARQIVIEKKPENADKIAELIGMKEIGLYDQPYFKFKLLSKDMIHSNKEFRNDNPLCIRMKDLLNNLHESVSISHMNQEVKLPSEMAWKQLIWAIEKYRQLQYTIEYIKVTDIDTIINQRNNIKRWIGACFEFVREYIEESTSEMSKVNGIDNRLKLLIRGYERVKDNISLIFNMLDITYKNKTNDNMIMMNEEVKPYFELLLINGEYDLKFQCEDTSYNWHTEIKDACKKIEEWPTHAKVKLNELKEKRNEYCRNVMKAIRSIENVFNPDLQANDDNNVESQWSVLGSALVGLEDDMKNDNSFEKQIWDNTSPIEDIVCTLKEVLYETNNRMRLLNVLYMKWNDIHLFVNNMNESQNIKAHIQTLCDTYKNDSLSLRKQHRRAKVEFEDAEDYDEPVDDLRQKVLDIQKKIINQQQQFHKSLWSYSDIVHQHCPELLHTTDKSFELLQNVITSSGLIQHHLSYESFSNIEEINSDINDGHVAGRHPVFKAELNGKIYALKQFLKSKRNRLLKEAKILKLLSHPYIAEVCGVIPDTLRANRSCNIYLQLPYYEYGSLSKLIPNSENTDIDVNRIRILMKQVALGLEHIHKNDIVHCDIKPSNIFLEDEYHCRIGDFDVSKTNDERMTIAVAIGYASTMVGHTPEYAAPEVLKNDNSNKKITKATSSSDIYSFGLMLYDLHVIYNGLDNNRPCILNRWKLKLPPNMNKSLSTLLRKILVYNPKKRPSMSDILNYEYFTASDIDLYKEVKEKEEKRLGETYDCCVCCETYREIEGVLCPNNRHFLCDGCFSWKVCVDSNKNEEGLMKRQGLIYCPNKSAKHDDACIGEAYSDQLIAAHIKPDIFDKYMSCRKEVIETQLSNHYETEYKSKLEEEMKKWKNTNERERIIRQSVNHITDNMLTLKCQNPNGSGQAILDFDDCFAVTCNRCHTEFCAWCLKWCNANAHPHVLECDKNMNPNSYYGTYAQFNDVHRQSKRDKIAKYLSTLSNDIVGEVMERIHPLLS